MKPDRGGVESARVSIVGTGFIARGLAEVVLRHPILRLSRVLTRRLPEDCTEFPVREQLTRSVDEVIDHSDIVVECSGDVLHATEVIERVLKAGLPVVTMNSEVQVTTGSYLAGLGTLTEAEGDQPGCLAALAEDAIAMGFRPLVYGNIKGFLNRTPTPDEMRFWSAKQGISLDQVVSFTDGTKVQIEQAFVANGLGASIVRTELVGEAVEDLRAGAFSLAERAATAGVAFSDYVLSPKSPAGVFVVGTHEDVQRPHLRYYKLGEGPYYLLLKNHHLCHLEIPKTLLRILAGGPVLLNNSLTPTIGVLAVAKKKLRAGDEIARAIGGFDVRGVAGRIEDHRAAVPIGLLKGARVLRDVDPGEMLEWRDVEPPAGRAVEICSH